jgi:hypothetical protein
MSWACLNIQLSVSKSVGITLNNYVSVYEFLLKELKYSSDKCRDSLPDLVPAVEDAIIKLQLYYNKSSVVANLASVLDPRKKMTFFRKVWADNPEDVIGLNDQFSDAYRYYKNHEEPKTNQDSTLSVISNSGYLSFMKEMGDENNKDDELMAFLNSPTNDFSINPLDLWKTNSSVFPVLSRMAKDYLVGMATSVPSEEVFSGGVDVITPNRMSLGSDSVTKVMSLKNWLKKW